ncbi:MAG: Serine--tRNA ligase [Firmicutes bacterium]|nr:Serine--tRNA ligase [candidate division NPL-UPA2 bacterium]
MLDIKLIRNNMDKVAAGVAAKGEAAGLAEFQALDEARRQKITAVEQLKAQRNSVTQEIARRRQKGEDTAALQEEMKEAGQKVKDLDAAVSEIEFELEALLLRIPNLPDSDVPIGADDTENVEIKRVGEPRQFSFPPKAHWDIGVELNILDFERAGKIAGSRFALYRGLGARLERALINFMLDLHTHAHGYTEVFPPLVVSYACMQGTGQFPKFTDDAFKLADKDLYLNPTAEVPVTNMHRDEIIDGHLLPLYYTAYCPSFRAEAGAAGRDARGLIRMHQFNKVELVKFVTPETSEDELLTLLRDACRVLDLLEIPYRIVQMCTGDLGFAAAKKYDIELWLPSYNRYMEISSCSNFRDFQARRANIKYKPTIGAKAEYVHTLNGSGLAVDRLVAAVLENYQTEDGSVTVPAVLRPYMQIEHMAK